MAKAPSKQIQSKQKNYENVKTSPFNLIKTQGLKLYLSPEDPGKLSTQDWIYAGPKQKNLSRDVVALLRQTSNAPPT